MMSMSVMVLQTELPAMSALATQRPRGRPPKAAADRRVVRMMIRLTAEEMDLYRAAAKRDGVTLAEWIRHGLARRAVR